MPDDGEAMAIKYRREAEHLRHAVEMIDDERLREQLLGFARQYDAAAGLIEAGAAVAGHSKPVRPMMQSHKFSVGQKVMFTPDLGQDAKPGAIFVVVRQLPEAAGLLQYE